MQTQKLSLAIDHELLARLVAAAEGEGTSLDAFVTTTLRTKLRDQDRDETTRRLVEWTHDQI